MSNKAYDAMRRCMGSEKEMAVIAERLNLSVSYLEKMCRKPKHEKGGTGELSYIQRTDQIMKIARTELERSEKDVTAPLFWLADQHGYTCIKLSNNKSFNGCLKSFTTTIKEFGELADSTATTLQDGTITKDEYKTAYKEGMETVAAIMNLLDEMGRLIDE